MSIKRSYSISNVSLQVECGVNGLGKKVIRAFEDYVFMIRSGSLTSPHNISLNFRDANSSFKAPETAQELFTSSSLRVLKDGDFCYLVKEKAIFQLDLANSMGTGFMDSAFWEESPKSKQDFLMLSLLWLLRKHDLYGLHANGLDKDGSGALFIGGTGSGKSTIALSLIRQGWDYLSDDAILIRDSANEVEAVAFQRGFFFDPYIANHYPELNKTMETSSNGQKRFMDINTIYPDRFLPKCIPKALIFSKIVPQDKSCLIPIDRTKAMILLIENSGGIMVEKEMVVKQIEVLKHLTYQSNSYQLLAGHDLYEEPEKISEVMSGVMSESLLKDKSSHSAAEPQPK